MSDRDRADGARKSRSREAKRVLQRLRRDAALLARAHRLPVRSLEPEHANVKRRYGVCYDDGSIRIRLRHLRTGSLLKYSSLIDTLCHELAHLRHFDHGPHFEALYGNILAYARRTGIYQPGPRGVRREAKQGRCALRLHASSILPLARLEAGPRGARRPLGRAGGREGGIPGQLELFR